MRLERSESHTFYLAVRLRPQGGSVCKDFAQIPCPVHAGGSKSDGYSNATPQLLALIEPWAHPYPQTGLPGPVIKFLQEALSWWANG